jgi:hypothetical protein
MNKILLIFFGLILSFDLKADVNSFMAEFCHKEIGEVELIYDQFNAFAASNSQYLKLFFNYLDFKKKYHIFNFQQIIKKPIYLNLREGQGPTLGFAMKR